MRSLEWFPHDGIRGFISRGAVCTEERPGENTVRRWPTQYRPGRGPPLGVKSAPLILDFLVSGTMEKKKN